MHFRSIHILFFWLPTSLSSVLGKLGNCNSRIIPRAGT